MKIQWEGIGDQKNEDADFQFKQRQQMLRAQEDRIRADIEIAAIKLGL
jgi:hypothetical protein